MRGTSVQYRQGDVLVVFQPHIGGIPEAAKEIPVDPKRGNVVLAYGEVTGHAHEIAAIPFDVQPDQGQEVVPNPVRYWDANGERFIQALLDVTLRHEEHGSIFLGKGVYRQAFQVEDFGVERRAVAD